MLTGEEFRRAHLGTFDERDQMGDKVVPTRPRWPEVALWAATMGKASIAIQASRDFAVVM